MGGIRQDGTGPVRYRHPVAVRIGHWMVAICFPFLIMSGLNIFNAYPELRWGVSSDESDQPLLALGSIVTPSGEVRGVTFLLGRTIDTTGLFGVSQRGDEIWEERGFPAWMTLPADRWLSLARRWHLCCAWVLTLTGVSYVGYSLLGGHLRRDLLPGWKEWGTLGETIRDHLLLRRPKGESAARYNLLQKLAYLTVICLLFPLIIVSGLGMSPGLNALFTGWVDLLGGRQSARTLHFITAWTLVAFLAIHLFQIVVTGFWNNLRSMITGYYRVPKEN